jgi:hypothetical protein
MESGRDWDWGIGWRKGEADMGGGGLGWRVGEIEIRERESLRFGGRC